MFTFTKAAVLAIVPAVFTLRSNAGMASFYYTGNQYGGCDVLLHDTDFIVALSPDEFANGANCGRRIGVTYQDKFVNVTVADECPTCGPGHIDLSVAAFLTLTNSLTNGLLQDVDYEYE